jgi:hypothetical protein
MDPLRQAQDGHGNHGCRIRRGDGHAGAQAQVGVGGAKHHGQNRPSKTARKVNSRMGMSSGT